MTYSPDSVGMHRHTFTGRPAFTGQPRSKTPPDFMSCFALHVAECEQTGRDGSAANYLTAYRMLVKYMNGRKLLPEQFTAEWLERYERWLLARGLGTNSVVFHMRYLRAVYNKAADRGSLSELHPKYALARDLFMFSFYTRGMSFVDMIYLRKSDISDGVLTYKRKKTGQTLTLRIEPPLQRIIDRYNGDSPYILPVLARDDSYRAYRQQQRELNKFIRKIGAMLEISEPLTFYAARHSWATLARDCGTPLTVISAGMGHTSERTTRIYLAQLDHDVIDKANRKIINL